MLDIKWIRETPDALVKALVSRGSSVDEAQKTVDELIAIDERRRAHLTELQLRQERRNTASKEIGNAIRSGDAGLADRLKAEVGLIKDWLANAEQTEREIDADQQDKLASVANIPLPDVPVGKDEHDNVELRRWGADLIAARQRNMGNKPKEHFELGEALGMMDFERAAKISGARFTVLKGQLARLERALGQFMLDLHTTEHGYEEVQPPLLVRDDAMFGTGQLPKFADDLFRTTTSVLERLLRKHEAIAQVKARLNSEYVSLTEAESEIPDYVPNPNPTILGKLFDPSVRAEYARDAIAKYQLLRSQLEAEEAELVKLKGSAGSSYLIPTSEVPLTNLVRDEITPHDKLPLRFTALTPCFRSEAGSAGRDTRGMLRQHQFYKVEMVSITDAETSLAEHERMTQCAEEVLKRLGLPFRTMVLCTGDMGFGARKTHDIEVWLPGQNAFREISSCSVCGDFQARRMDARYKDKETRQNRFVHTLNGSGVAVGRALIAVMENYQNDDGSITVPDVLRPYMGGLERIG